MDFKATLYATVVKKIYMKNKESEVGKLVIKSFGAIIEEKKNITIYIKLHRLLRKEGGDVYMKTQFTS